MKKIWSLLGALVLMLTLATKAEAKNIIGIHILDTAEVEYAAKLVNSNGGDWGWVTIVLRDDDLNTTKWQKFFDGCRRFHLIPIVRIATHIQEGGFWAKPDVGDLDKWPDFLAKLNWPVKNKIVVLFNEPNHATEWGREINPRDYAQISSILIQKFNERNSNFIVLNAGFDQAADGNKGTMREETFLSLMNEAVPGIFSQFEGWATHSYPNHGYVGMPTDIGRATIKGYEWELQKVAEVEKVEKVDKEIYITETGWPHSEGLSSARYYNEEKVADLLTEALQVWEADEKVAAVTPFVLNFPEIPFDHFSWLKKDGGTYKQYEKVLGLSKEKNEPEQVETFELENIKLGEILPTNYLYKGKIKIKNTGQWIMGEKNDELRIMNYELSRENAGLIITKPRLKEGELVEPGGEVQLDFQLKTGTQSAEERLKIGDKEYTIYIFRPFDLKNTKVSLWRQIWTKIKLVMGN